MDRNDSLVRYEPAPGVMFMPSKYNNILDRIGWTPLVPVNKLNSNRAVQVLAKLESFNPGGSIKDRAALYMIESAEASGELTREKIILEATSGNTGIGLSLVAAVKGYRILLVMSEAVSEERKKILKAMGAELKFTPARLSTDGAIEYVYGLVREEPEKYWLADQYNNEANWKAHYEGTAMEIWEQTGGELDVIIASMGTTGTLMGLARRFRELKPEVEIVGVEPYMGHRIQGLKNMKESYRPEIFDKRLAHRIVHADDDEAYQTARALARREGIFVGMSSGAAMAAALRLARERPGGRMVVIMPDGGERYLSTSLFVDRRESGLRFYNTLARKREEFVPREEDRVSVYTCGPTLCERIRIGESRRYVVADLLRRYLEYRGFAVTHILNVTDLDDRTIAGAEKAGQPLEDFTESYHQAFLEDLDALHIKRASAYPRASRHVEDMLRLSERLLEKGFAYEKFRSLYFDISRFRDYGRLSRIDLDKIRVGKTVDLDQYEKENPRDFTLLKRATLSELKRGIFYETRWGNVRPSWHLECPAMAMALLGTSYDIHTSGIELVFPHHENAIAVSQAATGSLPARYWIHNETVTVQGGTAPAAKDPDAITLRQILDRGYSGRQIRYWLISHHYRKPISFVLRKLDAAGNTLSHLDLFVRKLHNCRKGEPHPEMDQLVYDLKHAFTEALDDDLNVAQALAALFGFARRVNRIMDARGLSPEDRGKIQEALRGINTVLDVMDFDVAELDPESAALMKARDKARGQGDWESADRIRRTLRERGIELIDTRQGTTWRPSGRGRLD